VVWNDQVDMCADALYLQLTGRPQHELFPSLAEPLNA
jgi:hypothetical protein